jgi:hypothetical protein
MRYSQSEALAFKNNSKDRSRKDSAARQEESSPGEKKSGKGQVIHLKSKHVLLSL